MGVMAAQAWLVAASIPRIATLPRVTPCPYIAISSVPVGKIFAEEFSSPAGVIFSSVAVMVEYLISVVFTHGIIPPSQYSLTSRLGVPPDERRATLPRRLSVQLSGIGPIS